MVRSPGTGLGEVGLASGEEPPKEKASKGGWEAEELSRRDWLKLGLALGTIGGVAAVTAAFGGALLTPESPSPYGADALVYTRLPTDQWWNSLENEPMRVGDFALWAGATGVWRGNFANGTLVTGSGLPVLVIRIPRDDVNFRSPPATVVPLPAGYSLYYDDPARDLRLVALYDRCVHLCCYPGWQVVTTPPPGRDYVSPCPTYQVYGLDPIYCLCHGSQYDPMVLTTAVTPTNPVEYVGAQRVHGPAGRCVPLIPLRVDGDILNGGMVDPSWYKYCGD